MNALNVFRKWLQAVLGGQEIVAYIPSSRGCASTFFAVETSCKGYCVEWDNLEVIVKRVDPWSRVIGFPPLYYFKGRMMCESEGIVVVKGQVLVSKLPMMFICVWVSAVFLALAGSMAWAAVLAWKVMIYSSTAAMDDLSIAGLMIGAGLGVGGFGVLVVGVIRAISSHQRQLLIAFCSGAR